MLSQNVPSQELYWCLVTNNGKNFRHRVSRILTESIFEQASIIADNLFQIFLGFCRVQKLEILWKEAKNPCLFRAHILLLCL